MIAPLFDVKAKSSAYVAMVGKCERFSHHYKKWRKDCGDDVDDSYAEFLEGCRKDLGSEISNPFGGEE